MISLPSMACSASSLEEEWQTDQMTSGLSHDAAWPRHQHWLLGIFFRGVSREDGACVAPPVVTLADKKLAGSAITVSVDRIWPF